MCEYRTCNVIDNETDLFPNLQICSAFSKTKFTQIWELKKFILTNITFFPMIYYFFGRSKTINHISLYLSKNVMFNLILIPNSVVKYARFGKKLNYRTFSIAKFYYKTRFLYFFLPNLCCFNYFLFKNVLFIKHLKLILC